MQEHNFDEILDYLCSGIMSKSEKQSVRDELYDHLMCKYEINLAVGMDEAKATEAAIDALGNKTLLKENLQKVHWYYPAQSLKSALMLAMIALIMPVFVMIFGSISNLTEALPVFIIAVLVLKLVSSYTLRLANDKFYLLFKIDMIFSIFSIAWIAIQPYLKIDYNWNAIVMILSVVLWMLSAWLCIDGIEELIKPYSQTEYGSKAKNTYISMLGFSVLHFLRSWIQDLYFGWFFNLIFISFVLVQMCSFVSKIWGISELLYKSDHEYKVDISVKKRTFVVLAALIFAVVAIGGSDFIYSNLKITKSDDVIYSVEDFEIDQNEYENICENLISYGIPEKYVSLMPKSEISNYKGVVNKSELTESAQKLFDYYELNLSHVSAFYFYYGDDYERQVNDCISIFNYAVCLGFSESGRQQVRFIKIFTIPSGATEMYKDAVIFNNTELVNNGVYGTSDDPQNGDLLVAMRLDDGKVFRKDVELIDDYEITPIEGFKFDAEPGTVIIYATTREITDVSSTICNLGITYYHQKYPFTFPVRTVENAVMFEENKTQSVYEVTQQRSNHFYVMPDCEYIVPVESEKNKFIVVTP